MADWNNPTITSLYVDFLTLLKARDSDLAKMFDAGTPTNVLTDTIRWNSSASRFEKWDGDAWVELVAKYLIAVDQLDGLSYTDFAADPGGNGIIIRTSAGTAVARSIIGGVAIGLTNGSGVSGNPSVRVILGAGDRILGRISGGGDAQEITMTAAGRALVDDANASAQRATLGLGTAAVLNYTDFAADPGGNGIIIRTAAGSALARSIVGGTAIGLTNGSGVSGNPSIRVILGAGDRILGRISGGGDAQEITMTAAGRALVDDANASAQRATLGLGTAAVKNIGTSGDTIPKNDTLNIFSATQMIVSTDAGVTAGPDFVLYRNSASPNANDLLARLTWRGKDSGGNDTLYAQIAVVLVDPTDTSEVGEMRLQTTIAGALGNRLHVRAGLYTPGATGGDQGADTINVSEVYEDGVRLTGGFTLGTEQSTASGSSVTFGGIPAGTTMIIIEFEEVSLTDDSDLDIIIGDVGGLETSGYVSTSARVENNNVTSTSSSTVEFIIYNDSTTRTYSGQMILTLKDSSNFTWVMGSTLKASLIEIVISTGRKSLDGELTQVSIGGGTFDGGSINIMYQ